MFAKLLALFPHILAGIIAVEQAVKAPGQTKKQIVLGAVTAAAKVGEDIPVPLVQGISALIDQTVATLNAAGVFGHVGEATPVIPITPIT